MRKLIGRILATSVFLQASFFIGAQDFGRRAMPFGFCHRERERSLKDLISSVNKGAEKLRGQTHGSVTMIRTVVVGPSGPTQREALRADEPPHDAHGLFPRHHQLWAQPR